MTSGDLPAFTECFNGLRRVFRQRGTDQEVNAMLTSYFRSLRPYPIATVIAGADAWTGKGRFFPKPAEWIAHMPAVRAGTELRQMPVTEAREYRRAELRGYEDDPCGCEACQSAGVTHRFPRFVPEFDDQDREVKAFDPLMNRVVVVGHWAHGEELARWYAAKEDFYAKFERWATRQGVAKTSRKSFQQRMRDIFDRPKDPPAGNGL